MADNKFFAQGHALIIGVGKYHQNSLSVPVTAKDAETLGQVLKDSKYCAYPENQVTVLTNELATRKHILAALDSIRKRVENSPNSTVVIFFSGHGWQQEGYYFLTHEAELIDVELGLHLNESTALSNQEFLEYVRRIQARRCVIIFNTCFAGGVGTALSPQIGELTNFKPVPLGPYEKLLEGTGRVILSSSLAGENSWIKPGAKHSLFVTHLLTALEGQGLQSHDQMIRVLDIFKLLSEYVPKDAATIGETQTPVLKAYDVTQDFPIALLRGGKQLSPEAISQESSTLRPRNTYNTATIRKMMSSALSDEEINDLCQDHFPEVYEQFALGMGKKQKIHRLIDYCTRRNRMDQLLDLIKGINPDQFNLYVDKFG